MKAAPMEICISQPLVPTPNFRLLHKQGGEEEYYTKKRTALFERFVFYKNG